MELIRSAEDIVKDIADITKTIDFLISFMDLTDNHIRHIQMIFSMYHSMILVIGGNRLH